MLVDTNRLSEALGLSPIEPFEVDTGDSKSHWGGWDMVNSSDLKQEWSKEGGAVRARDLPEQSKRLAQDEAWLAKVRETNKATHAGNKHALGYKHSTEMRKRMSLENPNRGKVWCVPSDAISLECRKPFKKGEIPEGWMSCRDWKLKDYKGASHLRCWITNGEENRFVIRGSEIPEGWRLGRSKMTLNAK